MKQTKRHAKIAISACFLVGSTLVAVMKRLCGSHQRPGLTIIYYHGVPKDQLKGFERQMACLARRAMVVAADWDGSGLVPSSDPDRPLVAITFDDALESAIEHALPILAAHGFHATIFVPSGCLDQPPSWALGPNVNRDDNVAAADRLSQLCSDQLTIGSHTVSHPHLSALPEELARQEIEQSKRDLTALTGRCVELFAFPYGDHNDAVIELCRGVGYKHVYTTRPSPVWLGSDAFVRGRISVDPSDGPLEFFLKMSGCYRWMVFASAAKRIYSALDAGKKRLTV